MFLLFLAQTRSSFKHVSMMTPFSHNCNPNQPLLLFFDLMVWDTATYQGISKFYTNAYDTTQYYDWIRGRGGD